MNSTLTVAAAPHKYQVVANHLAAQIRGGALRPGDKLPSVRVLSREQGLSISTILQAYYALEAGGLVEVRPQSGYYVCLPGRASAALPTPTRPSAQPPEATAFSDTEDLIAEYAAHMHRPDLLPLSLSVPHASVLPVARLAEAVRRAQQQLPQAGTRYEPAQGNRLLRQQIARYSVLWGGQLTEHDLLTTEGCIAAISLCLLAITKPGDTLAVESPTYLGVLQLARALGRQVLELPTHPVTGIELGALTEHLAAGRVQACLLTPNFNNPMGSCMPEARKRELVQLLERYQVPLIEDDLYGDLHFGTQRPKPCKAFDTSGLVLWCGSVSKTLAPGYRVGWVAPGRYLEQLKRLKLYQQVASPGLTHQAIGHLLATGRYELHLRRLRRFLHDNYRRYARVIEAEFAASKVSQPQGGFLLWVELPAAVSATALFRRAAAEGLSIAPGRMFTLHEQYHNCFRLSYGLPLTAEVEAGLRRLGALVREALAQAGQPPAEAE
ncbi:aminotransferase-like domain-containing protein [Hymenobacter chitinivorans]|uniref:DNA-binding transcriptional MocR family regulator n=1 Tax=Hymenobacter chitinivorans DSM 11115 TaxID=1121954 RepID=A0A2M9BNE8_9BACT|nr:PLP-dependent aminotransferase family protein [Hymenobacter chitinivorans]PJJ59483.1 DNA-binding transcriptional MocR family regulator [Hymenobacter chitinivorans DSM 11115]